MDLDRFACWLVTQQSSGAPAGEIAWLSTEELPPADGPSVVIEVEWSSLNYKDALAAQGHRGVVRALPHVPGIDCAGRIVHSDTSDWSVGQQVLVTGYELGSGRWGGYSGRVRVPADWPVALPPGLSTRDAMAYGTAGFTAAQCVLAIQERVSTDAGEVVVTGATGGVGCFAVAILAKLGYRVTATTGKPQYETVLTQLGAQRVADREAVSDKSSSPLLSERWAAGVDTVGGAPLSTVLRSTGHRGVVATCGMVAGHELPLTVYPFILRGVTLAGIDSAKCPRQPRLRVWELLAGEWRVELPEELLSVATLSDLPKHLEKILAGGVAGRTLVRPVAD